MPPDEISAGHDGSAEEGDGVTSVGRRVAQLSCRPLSERPKKASLGWPTLWIPRSSSRKATLNIYAYQSTHRKKPQRVDALRLSSSGKLEAEHMGTGRLPKTQRVATCPVPGMALPPPTRYSAAAASSSGPVTAPQRDVSKARRNIQGLRAKVPAAQWILGPRPRTKRRVTRGATADRRSDRYDRGRSGRNRAADRSRSHHGKSDPARASPPERPPRAPLRSPAPPGVRRPSAWADA